MLSLASEPTHVRRCLDELTSWRKLEPLREAMVADATIPTPWDHDPQFQQFRNLDAEQQARWNSVLSTCWEVGRAASLPCLHGEVPGVPRYAR